MVMQFALRFSVLLMLTIAVLATVGMKSHVDQPARTSVSQQAGR